jgi:hypothetical protein
LWWFWGPDHQIIAAGFEAETGKTVATGFDAKPDKTVQVILRPNHWQTIGLGFEAQPRNSCSSSPRAQCRPHTAPPNLSITQPLSTWHVQPFPILYIMSPTPATILMTARHATPTTCTPWDKQTRFSKWNNDKDKTAKPSRIQIQTSPSQRLITIKPRNWPLGFSEVLISHHRWAKMKLLLWLIHHDTLS